MNPKKLCDLVIKTLDDMQGIDILTLDVNQLTTFADYMIICTGRSTRHVKAMADTLIIKAKEHQISSIHMEGGQNSEWILVDLGDIIVHVMLSETRRFYNLEELWDLSQQLINKKKSKPAH